MPVNGLKASSDSAITSTDDARHTIFYDLCELLNNDMYSIRVVLCSSIEHTVAPTLRGVSRADPFYKQIRYCVKDRRLPPWAPTNGKKVGGESISING